MISIKKLQKENCELLEKMHIIDIETTQWKEEEFQLRKELHEAKLNSNQNLDGLREEIRLAEVVFPFFLCYNSSSDYFDFLIVNIFLLTRQQLKN